MGSFVNQPRMNPGMQQPSPPPPRPGVSGTAQMMQAMGQLATGAANFHEGIKRHNLQKYQAAVQGIVDGTNPNPDYKQILEWGKKAGLPIKTDVTQDDIQAQKMTKYQQQVDAQKAAVAPFAGVPGALGAMSQPGGLPQGQPPSPPQTQAPPGFMQRMLQGGQRFMGMNGGRPPVDINSPAGQFLQKLNAARQRQGGLPNDVNNQEDLKQLNVELQKATGKLGLQVNFNNMQMTGSIFQKMLQGDPAATQLLFKTGAIKDTPIDTYEAAIQAANPDMPLTDVRKTAGQTALYMSTGGPELKAKLFDLADKNKTAFGNNTMRSLAFLQDPTNPQNQPGLTAEDSKNLWDGMGKVLDAYTGVPLNLVSQMGTAQMRGDTDTSNKIQDFISKNYPRQNTTTTGLENRRLNQDYTNILGTLAIRGKEAETGRLGKLIDGAEALGAIPKEMIEHKDKYTPQQYIDAMRQAATENNAVADLLNQYGLPAAPKSQVREMGGAERGANIFGPATPTLGGVPAPQSFMQGQVGQMPTPTSPLTTPQGQQMQRMLSSMNPQDRVQAITNTHMDPTMQSALLDWTKEQEAQKPAPQALQDQIQQPPINGASGMVQNMFNLPPQQ